MSQNKEYTKQGSTMRPKHSHLRVTFVKCEYKFCIDSQTASLIFPEHFLSLTDRIFQFKFRHWLSGHLKRTIDSDIKVLNHILLSHASDHDEQKKTKKHHTKFFAKNKLVESTDHEAGMSDATSTEVWSQNSDEGSGSKAEMHKFHNV
jgi:hypothetical protein